MTPQCPATQVLIYRQLILIKISATGLIIKCPAKKL